jgi:hypothetical protein
MQIADYEEPSGRASVFQDVDGFGDPDERLGAFIVMVDVFADGLDEFLDVAEDAATQVVLSQVAEESLDHVQPHE